LSDSLSAAHILRYHFKYDGQTIDQMLPWEMDVELSMIHRSLKQELAARGVGVDG